MSLSRRAFHFICVLTISAVATAAAAQEKKGRFQPKEGMAGKDVVWVPTPDFMLEKMLDIGKVTAKDYVIDLGSGDGRNVIAAAKRGATAHGVEYNEKLVELSRELAKEAGVADKATFSQGDMYVADISKASVMILFLLNENLDKLSNKLFNLKPGSRIVINTFRISGWDPDFSETTRDCSAWCTVHLHIVPAKVGGSWQLGKETLTLKQDFQKVRGVLNRNGKDVPVEGRLNGEEIEFTAGGVRYEGRVDGGKMEGQVDGKPWSAAKRG